MLLPRDRYIRALAGFSLALLLVPLGLIGRRAANLPDELVLGFESDGTVRFGAVADVWGIWIMGVVFAAVNLVLADAIVRHNRALGYGMATANLIVAGLTLAAIGTILSIN